MDPLGFALENYDAIGQWREKDGETPIEPAGEFLDGTEFSGPIELKTQLTTTRRRDFARSLTEHMLTYALGRPLDYYDAVTVAEIGDRLEKDDFRMSRLIVEIVQSYPFRYMTPKEHALP